MSSRKINWTLQEEHLLFELHRQYGNKWAILSTKMNNKEDNQIKNKFYSTLRKGLRKINKYIINVKKRKDPIKFKAIKCLQQLFLTKVIAIVDQNFTQKYEVKQKAIDLAPGIQKRIINVAFSNEQYLKPQQKNYDEEQQLLIDILEFNRNCKKRKGKRRAQKIVQNQSQNGQPQQQVSNSKIPAQHQKQCSVQVPQQLKHLVKECQGQNNTSQKIKIQEVSVFPSFSHDQKQKPVTLFSNRAEEFFKQIQDNSQQLNQSHNLSLSGSLNYELITSGDMSKKYSGFFTQPSPLAGDGQSPFCLNNLMKEKNITGSNMFDEKTASVDLFSSGKICSSKKEDQTISLMDEIPLFKKTNSLFKSSDLMRSSQIMQKEDARQGGDCMKQQKKSQKLNQFLSSFSRPNFLSNDSILKDYAFGSRSDAVTFPPVIAQCQQQKTPKPTQNDNNNQL